VIFIVIKYTVCYKINIIHSTNVPEEVSFNIPPQAVHITISNDRQQNNITTNKNIKEKIPSLTRIALNSSPMQYDVVGTVNKAAPGIYRVSFKFTYSGRR
jgi:hypothetical protein